MENQRGNRYYTALQAEQLEETIKQYYDWHKLVMDRLEKAPPGRLEIHTQDGRPFYYLVRDGSRSYLPLEQTDLIQALAQKGYDLKAKRVLEKQIAQFEREVRSKTTGGENRLVTLWSAMCPARQELVEPLILPVEERARRWAEEPYEPKEFKEVDPEHYAKNGLRVRSKSERDTVNELLDFELYFKYEAPLHLRGLGLIHPDFMVMNKRTGQVFIWEHFGMVDERGYAQDMVKRIEAYHYNGYYEGKNFLYTMETQRTPFAPKDARRVIKQYLL